MYDDTDQDPAAEREPGETTDLAGLTQLLSRLSENPETFLDKQAADFPALASVRAAANRLIEAIKGAVRQRRGQGVAHSPVPGDTPTTPANLPRPQPTPVIPLRCYVCRTLVAQPHPEYPRMCQSCGDENLARRTRSADLTGRRALVTGARVRIGYQTALKLLRGGATVEGVTRFPALAATRYAEEPDFEAWSHRLTLHGVDLRHLSAVQSLAAELQRPGPLDLLINNAAQTIRRPRTHYALLVDQEQHRLQNLTGTARACLAPHDPHRCMSALTSQSTAIVERLPVLIGGEVATSARLTQVPLFEQDLAPAMSFLPVAWDAEGEPLDLREENSWSQTLEQIHGMELLEVHAVNALAPFLLIQALLPAFRLSPFPRRFIINVAAKEGRFSEANAARHPHTNMAKAALNMLTKTIASGLRREGIYANSVDPGWVSDQRPFPIAEQDRDLMGDWLPLDAVDGAARILAPVWDGVLNPAEPECGVLWRNYEVVPW